MRCRLIMLCDNAFLAHFYIQFVILLFVYYFIYISQKDIFYIIYKYAYFKSLILENFLDGDHLARVAEFGLVYHAEAAIADDLGVSVCDLLGTIWPGTGSRHYGRYLAAILACRVHCTTHRNKSEKTTVQEKKQK